MKISLCSEVLADYDFPRQCELAKQMGYDGLEIAPLTLSAEPHLLSSDRRKEIRRIAEDEGVPVTGLHYLLRAPEGLSITATDANVRARTVDVIRRLIALCHDLGGTIIVHGSPAQRRLEPGQETESYRCGVECWAAIAGDAEAAGVTYCIEPLHQPDANFVNTVEEAATIVRQIGSPAVRTMIDCSAASIWEKQSVPDLIRQWMPSGLIAHMHFNDTNRRGPGDGALKIAPIVAALRETGYAGNASIEPFIYIPDGATCAARNIGYMRGVMESFGHARA
ncbi:sugar phosphate isomerase/epimerase family protein [Pseudorhodoplanes sp.]|jgi:D-psicose/D-tagatose/L-ribulose 3-epimerase|uniref:sugar phosphate isomerase/epimerase family protein n=1 Tax=Pseudorhodoplanes sp. TaxID=1934341 RepID=UPI002C7DA06E|nr:sugar phosphate isomerase/epimerase family protein [Pseudorhodoplanes sp.]HWV44363.1 sugar phosphate isomerase/epimerase family protein [Pseudorhodoplanes sp.]